MCVCVLTPFISMRVSVCMCVLGEGRRGSRNGALAPGLGRRVSRF